MGRPRLIREVERANSERAGSATLPDGPKADVAWALGEISKRGKTAQAHRAYYDGDQRRMIEDDRLRSIFANLFDDFRLNLCKPVVDALVDRLQVNSFSSPEAEAEKKRRVAERRRAELERKRQEAALRMAALAGGSATAPPQEERPAGEDGEGAGPAENPEPRTPDRTPNRVATMLAARSAASREVPPRPEAGQEEEGEIDDAGREAEEIWERNRMRRRSGQVHLEAGAAGNSFVLVWPDETDFPIFYPQGAHEIAVQYDKEKPGRIVKAAKAWREAIQTESGKKEPGVRVNLYYPDRIEKYAARKPNDGWPEAKDFAAYASDENEPWPVHNPYGVVPIFHFANNADMGEYGVSELKDAIPVQDMANYLVFSLLVAVEFASLPQKYLIDVAAPKNQNGEEIALFKAGGENIWAFAGTGDDEGKGPQIGQLDGADLAALTRVMDLADRKMAQVTGTPIHYFQAQHAGPSTPVSGESEKVADTKLQNKVADRQIAFGDTWAAAMQLAIRMKRGPETSAEDISLDTNWKDTRPRNEKEGWEIAAMKRKAGVPQRQLLIELGYSEEQVDEFETMNMDAFYAAQSAPGPGAFSPGGVPGGTDINDLLDQLGVS